VSTFAALPPAGLVDTLPNKTPLELVGYGVEFKCKNSDPHPRWFLCGGDRKRVATSELVSGEFTSSDVLLRLAANPGGDSGGVCSGDSGGPNLKGGTDVVLAMTSWGNNLNCQGVEYGARIDKQEILDWINGPHQPS
jgi:hypothetical protein